MERRSGERAEIDDTPSPEPPSCELFLWVLSGATWWLCAHSLTLLFPLPGPWLPTEIAIPIGIFMGIIGRFLPRRREGTAVLIVTGLAAGAAAGWNFARGAPVGDRFLAPSQNDIFLSIVVCSALGLAANAGVAWGMARLGRRPIQLLAVLLFLVLIMLGGVTLVNLITVAPS
ncbi:MAG TPA: hypothetical protein P5057_12110 [Acidobacteriota bacterium]|nr:hypothetical protein [Acidobacteriota bacterium]